LSQRSAQRKNREAARELDNRAADSKAAARPPHSTKGWRSMLRGYNGADVAAKDSQEWLSSFLEGVAQGELDQARRAYR